MTAPTPPLPLGYCARCIAGGHRKPATTSVEGTSVCDRCALDDFHVHDEEELADILSSLHAEDRSNELGG